MAGIRGDVAATDIARTGITTVERDSSANYVAMKASCSDQDSPAKYVSINVQAAPSQRYRWIGAIFALRLPVGVVYIGPHWYLSMVMLCFITGVGLVGRSHIDETANKDKALAATLATVIVFFSVFVSDPGIVETQIQKVCSELSEHRCDREFERSKVETLIESARGGVSGDRRCSKCDVIQPKDCAHCSFCKVCIRGYDHHCPWMGKCIGSGNLCKFWTFIMVGTSSLIYIVYLASDAPSDAK